TVNINPSCNSTRVVWLQAHLAPMIMRHGDRSVSFPGRCAMSEGFLPSYPNEAPAPRKSSLASSSLGFGICSFLFGIVAGLPAIVQGCRALRQIHRPQGGLYGSGLALGGISLGVIGSVVSTGFIMFAINRLRKQLHMKL